MATRLKQAEETRNRTFSRATAVASEAMPASLISGTSISTNQSAKGRRPGFSRAATRAFGIDGTIAGIPSFPD
jgi:hypothetical protein